jgi:hypothetical protein
MKEEQERLIRFIFGQIRKNRAELDILYQKKKQLETLADQFYVSYLDNLWIKAHSQITEVYNAILDRYGVLKNLETQLLHVALDTGPINSINCSDTRE